MIMNKVTKTLLINLGATFLITLMLLVVIGTNNSSDFLVGLGLISLAVAVLDLLVALILFIAGKENYEVAKGFLLSSGILFLTGFSACSFTTMNFH